MFSTEKFTSYASRLRRFLGIPGVVLLAALLFDLLVVVYMSGFRAPLSVLGILGFAGCAMWAQRRAVVATGAGALVLVAGAVATQVGNGYVPSPLIDGVSPSQTVAGVELVFFCALRAAPLAGTLAVTWLVVATAFVTALADVAYGGSLTSSVSYGLIILVGTLATAVYVRVRTSTRGSSRFMEMIGAQWPLIGLLSLTYFFEMTVIMDRVSPLASVVLLTSAVAVLGAVLSTWYPIRGSFAFVIAVAATVPLVSLVTAASVPASVYGVPFSQVAAGLVTVVLLVRQAPPWVAARQLVLMSVPVAALALLDGRTRGLASTGELEAAASQAVVALGMAVAVGLYFRARDSERERKLDTAVKDAQVGERMALARELHDVVAHQVTGIVVQAQAAKMVASTKPEAAVEALGRIEQGGLTALTAMRRLVGSMREGESPDGRAEVGETATTDFAADLREVVDGWQHGIPVELDMELNQEVPAEVGRSALRLVQESLTNIARHASGASRAQVSTSSSDGELRLRISDDGTGSPRSPVGGSGGYGIVGMRERAELLGGLFTAGPGENGGWCVQAWLPLREVE